MKQSYHSTWSLSWDSQQGYNHHEKHTELRNELVSIHCTENVLNTSITINIAPTMDITTKNNDTTAVHMQIFFGDELFVCTKSMLSHLNTETIQAIVSFMFLKLIKW